MYLGSLQFVLFVLFLSSECRTISQNIISEIIAEDNELREENEAFETKVKPKFLPSYLSYLDELEVEGISSEEEGQGSAPRSLARVWLPVEIQEFQPSSHKRTSIIFQQNKPSPNISSFSKVELIFTKRSDVELSNEHDLFLSLFYPQNQSVPSQALELSQFSSYFSQDITPILRSFLTPHAPWRQRHPRYLNLSAELHALSKHALEDMELFSVFDLQVQRPFILFTYDDENDSPSSSKKSSRKKRSVSVSPSSGPLLPPHLCQRMSWEVDSANDIEWYDLVSPSKLELGFCAGLCPSPLLSDHFNYTLHSFFMDRHRINKVFNVPRNFPKSCCVPVSYKPLKVWVEEEENALVRKVIADLSVDQCGCR